MAEVIRLSTSILLRALRVLAAAASYQPQTHPNRNIRLHSSRQPVDTKMGQIKPLRTLYVFSSRFDKHLAFVAFVAFVASNV